MYILEKTLDFDSAHFLKNYKGACSRLHGHCWKLKAVITGNRLNKLGILIDFKDIKEILKQFDHHEINKFPPFNKINPTAENLSKFFKDELQKYCNTLDNKPIVQYIDVYETETSLARYQIEDSSFANWFSGFFDGEGYFLLASYSKNKSVIRCGIQLRRDDLDILQEIQSYFQCGKITFRTSGKNTFNPGQRFAMWNVESRKDIVDIIIPHFDKYSLRAKKQTDYLIWREGIQLLENRNKFKLGKKVEIEFKKLVKKLKDNRVYLKL